MKNLIIALLFSGFASAQCPELESPEKEIDYDGLEWKLKHYETVEYVEDECAIRKVYECKTDSLRTVEIVCRLEKELPKVIRI